MNKFSLQKPAKEGSVFSLVVAGEPGIVELGENQNNNPRRFLSPWSVNLIKSTIRALH